MDSSDVLVLGGGLAGLSASLAFARIGRNVLLLERDGHSPPGDADTLFEDWHRPGIAHFRQPHNFLALGRDVLRREAPEVLESALELGALENRQYELAPGPPRDGDEALVSICARRPVFESALAHAVESEPNVRIERDIRVTALLSKDSTRVDGVRTDDGRELHAPLVVDALGRSSPTSSWLEGLGARPTAERRTECGVLYYSRHYRFRPGVEMPALPTLLRAPRGALGYLAFAIFVEDNRSFALVLMIPTWERDLRELRFEAPYQAAALAVPALVPWVHPDQSEPLSTVLPMGSLQNMRRSLVVDGEPVAIGVQPIGDSLCHTNPTFAFGASLAIAHAFALAQVADERDDPRSIALAFEEAVGRDASARFESVSAEDRDRTRLWQGEPIDIRDPTSSMALFLRVTAYGVAADDADLFRAVARRINLLDSPDALEQDAALVARAVELTQDREAPPAQGPTRDDLLATIAAVSS